MNLFNVPDELITRRTPNKIPLPEYRTDFMRDRDRIMYATAFRRLAGKTQIYTVGTDDHKRNRLTHTLEVAQIARTIAIGLNLNPELAEAIALGHDFGHTPFGHAGERMLHKIMIPESDYVKNSPFYKRKYKTIENQFKRENVIKPNYYNYAFGFKHNLQSARVCSVLEDSYRGDKGENIGLNLTNFTLYGMIIHSGLKYKDSSFIPTFHKEFDEQLKIEGTSIYAWSFEAYVVAWADEIAQWHHDLEDALRGGALPVKDICETIKTSLEKQLDKDDKEIIDSISENKMDRKTIADLSHIVVNTLVNNIIHQTKENFKKIGDELNELKIADPVTVFKEYENLNLSIPKDEVVAISKEINTEAFKGIIKNAVHYSRNVERMNEKGTYIIRKLFEAYYTHPQQLPDGPILHLLVDIDIYKSIDDAKEMGVGKARVKFDEIMKNPNIHVKCILMRRICDHIASMTDHYAIEEYNNLYG